ncbi:MAG: hypothetical protein ABI191_05820 [Rhizomicrobium sp.]
MCRRFTIWAAFGGIFGCLIFSPPEVVAQDNSTNRIVLTEMRSWVLKWDSGTLTGAATDKEGHKTPVTVRFKVQNHHLSRLSITTTRSTLDVSHYVERLDMPFIGRLGIFIAAGTVDDMRISLPYIDYSKKVEGQCMSFGIGAKSGKVESAEGVEDDSSDRCEP